MAHTPHLGGGDLVNQSVVVHVTSIGDLVRTEHCRDDLQPRCSNRGTPANRTDPRSQAIAGHGGGSTESGTACS